MRLWEGGRYGLHEIALNGADIHRPQTPLLDRHDAEAHPHLLDDAVLGNPESEAIGRHLHAQAWDCLKLARDRELSAALAQYRESLASPRSAAGITDVVPCALQGRVHVLAAERMPGGADIAALSRF